MANNVPNMESIEGEKFTSKKDTFPHDPEVTDFTFIVEGRKLHVVKAVLIDASQVFRRMLTGEFKEKKMSELELPGKEYPSFELFLRCLYPREYTLTEARIDELLPLAGEYNVKSILHKCESWLLMELEFKEAKVHPHYVSVDNDVAYLIKCFYYGSVYCLEELYKKSIDSILPYKLARYTKNKHYLMLPEKNKRELTETRLLRIEDEVYENQDRLLSYTEGSKMFKCSNTLFM